MHAGQQLLDSVPSQIILPNLLIAPCEWGHAALHHASQAGHTEVAAKLVIAGAPVQTADTHGRTPAHLAARRGAHEVVDKLLMAGYEVDALGGDCGHGPMEHAQAPAPAAAAPTGVNGCAVLHLAARHGHLTVCGGFSHACLLGVGQTTVQCLVTRHRCN